MKAHSATGGFIAGWSSLVAREAHNLKVARSNPPPASKNVHAAALTSEIAQSVEQLPGKQWVAGSSPALTAKSGLPLERSAVFAGEQRLGCLTFIRPAFSGDQLASSSQSSALVVFRNPAFRFLTRAPKGRSPRTFRVAGFVDGGFLA